MAKSISDTHNFVQRLTQGNVFTDTQAERLKEVINDDLDVVTESALERALQRQMIQILGIMLSAMLAQTALLIAAVQWIMST
ncbi:MAG: hypothetical protein AB7U75_17370 [Hyphomicrobiaceae bacterium]